MLKTLTAIAALAVIVVASAAAPAHAWILANGGGTNGGGTNGAATGGSTLSIEGIELPGSTTRTAQEK